MTPQAAPARSFEVVVPEPEISLVRVPIAPAELRPGRDRLIVAGMVVAGALLRAPNLARAFWVDEGISVGISSHPLAQLPALLRLDGSPPLYYVLLHGWLGVFGSSEVSVHTMSLLISLAVIPLAWWAGRDLFGRQAGLCAALLATTNPFLAWYATETRMYPMACALALVAVAMSARAMRDRSLVDVGWAVLALAALIYTHNWGFYLVAATIVVFGVLAVRHRDTTELMVVAGAGTAVGLLYLPWLPVFVDQARNTAAPWAVPPSIGDFFADPASVLGGTLGLVILPLFAVGVLRCLAETQPVYKRLGLAFVAIAGVIVVEGWLAAQIEPSWASRYLAVALGPALLGLAGLLGTTRRGRQLALAAAALLTAWSVVGSLLPDVNARYAKSNLAAVVGAVHSTLAPGDLVLVTQSEQLAVAAYYLPAGLRFSTPLGAVSDPHVVDWRHLTARLEQADPCQTVGPQIAALPIGARVFVIAPLEPIGAAGSRWAKAVAGQVERINQLLSSDPGLHLEQAVSQAFDPEPFSPVIGLLFVKTSGAPLCAGR